MLPAVGAIVGRSILIVVVGGNVVVVVVVVVHVVRKEAEEEKESLYVSIHKKQKQNKKYKTL